MNVTEYLEANVAQLVYNAQLDDGHRLKLL